MRRFEIAYFGSEHIIRIIPKKKNNNNGPLFSKILTSLLTSCFFCTLRDAWNFFPINTTCHIFATNGFIAKSFHKYHKSTRHSRHSMLLAIGTCALVFYNNMCHDWNKYDQSQLGKEKSTLLIWRQRTFFAMLLLRNG